MKLLLLYITCFFCLQQTLAQYTQVPDPNFEQALIDLGYDDVIDGQFLTVNAQGVLNINLDNKNINNLSGIEAFIDLEQLFAYGNSIENIDLSLLPADLWTLDLANNNLSTIDLSPVPQVVNLYLSKNNLTSIDASNMVNVFILEAGTQPLSNIDITNCTNLFFLDVYEIPLQSLDISTCSNLAYLYCFDSQLSSLDFSGNPEIEEIWANSNPLTSINLPNNPMLEMLKVGGSLLTSLDLTSCTGLLEVQFLETTISQIDFSNNYNLERIWGTNSQLTSLDITNNPNLIELWCSNNNISGSIDVSYNTQIEDIEIQNNPITAIEGIANCTNLVHLICQETLVQEIDLSQNQNLSVVDFYMSPNLQFVNMQNGANEDLFIFIGNLCPQLSCVVVDDPTAENENFGIDANTTLVGSPEDCNLSLSEVALQELITIYPNPAQEYLQLNTQDNIAINTVHIYNVLGNIVYQANNPNQQINIADLSSGLLFVQLETDKGRIIKKVVKE